MNQFIEQVSKTITVADTLCIVVCILVIQGTEYRHNILYKQYYHKAFFPRNREKLVI